MKMEKLSLPPVLLSAEDIKRCRSIALQKRDFVCEIATAVAAETGVPVRAIYGNSRKRQVAEARQLVMYIAVEHGISTNIVGYALNRDHTTVIHGHRAEKARRGL